MGSTLLHYIIINSTSDFIIILKIFFIGESVPVTKTALTRMDKEFDLKEHNSSVLFCGTKVIQTRYYSNEPVK